MPVYTVHEPPRRDGQAAGDPERIVFVRDGFHFWAFVFGPFWMLWHGLWLVLLLFVVATAALQVGLAAAGLSGGIRTLAGFAIALLIGFEAGSLRRWTLARRKWTNLGVVVAGDLEAAERRFFDSHLARARPRAAATPPATGPVMRVPESASDVIGLFPEPETRR